MKYGTITRDNIRQLVDEFYGQVREDALLGPVFLAALGTDWDAHLERLAEFWSTVVLGTRSFHGNVHGTHMQLEGIEPAHFERWLALFGETANRLFEADAADQFLVLARRVASSFQLGYFGEIRYSP
jgi:hemoglobin